MTKLRYETQAGNISEGATYSQLIEHLRLASEACYVLGHYYKANNQDLRSTGFLMVGGMLEKTVGHVTDLATKGRLQ